MNLRKSERGEGKVGCILTLLVLLVVVAVGAKVGPVMYADMELADASEYIASSASRMPAEQVEATVRQKARDLGIDEAVTDKTAIKASVLVAEDKGTCNITLRYTRNVDIYGLTKIPIAVNRTITKPIYTKLG